MTPTTPDGLREHTKALYEPISNERQKNLITQLKSSAYRLKCEIGRCKVTKKEWEDRICRFCNKGVVETEWHYLKDCTTYEDIRSQHKEI